MAFPCSLPETQSQKEIDWSQNSDVEVPKIWGWLYPTRIHLKSLDISKQSITLGRTVNCDIILNGQNISPNILRIVSKLHFRIYRDECEDGSYIIYLEDTSYNGTYINGKKIGRGKKIILQNDDEIAIGHPSVKIYKFKCIYDCSDLPKVISSKYIVSKLLGTGACGEVRLIWNKLTCEKFAMKKVNKKKLTICKSPQINDPKRIMNEVKILKSLQHPFVIHMEDIIDTDDAVYIILELMEGGELFDRIISCERLSEDEAKLIFYQIVLAVNYLHEQGITHRDLKPENILLATDSNNPQIKVSDFGLSKFVAEESVLKTVCGTPMYVAPEILLTKGRGTYTKQIDVWSLGVILYVMISGHLPFNENNDKLSLGEQIINGIYGFPKNCFDGASADVIDLIKRMLVVNPEERYNTNQILEHKWFIDDVLQEKIDSILNRNTSSSQLSENSLKENLYVPNPKRIKLDLGIDK